MQHEQWLVDELAHDRVKIKTNGAHGTKQNDLIDCECYWWKENCMQTKKNPETLKALDEYDLYCMVINSVSYHYKSCFHTDLPVASEPLL